MMFPMPWSCYKLKVSVGSFITIASLATFIAVTVVVDRAAFRLLRRQPWCVRRSLRDGG
jgi:hypothetical protein